MSVGLKRIESFYRTTKITRKGCLSYTCKHDELSSHGTSSLSNWPYAQLHYFLNLSQLLCFLSAIIGQID